MIKTSQMIDNGMIWIFTFGSGQALEGKKLSPFMETMLVLDQRWLGVMEKSGHFSTR